MEKSCKTIRNLIFAISDVDNDAAINMIFEKKDSIQVIVTPNIDHLMRFDKDESFRVLYSVADIYFNDSVIIKYLSRFLWSRNIRNVNRGSDLTIQVMSKIPCDGKVLLIGGEAGDDFFIKRKYGINRVEQIIPDYGFYRSSSSIDKLVDQICNSEPDYLFLCVGSPQQELVASILKDRMSFPSKVLCVGASLDFIAGRQVRAPRFISSIGMEWAFRMLSNPRRLFSRYFKNFVWLVSVTFKSRNGL
ncbi:MAG: WecB/TagA/CpsF family glycosyltransferase [Motiliproteus sp.]